MYTTFIKPTIAIFSSPGDFFSEMKYRYSYLRALSYGVFSFVLALLGEQLWQLALSDKAFNGFFWSTIFGGELVANWSIMPALIVESLLLPIIALSLIASFTLFFHLIAKIAGARQLAIGDSLLIISFVLGSSSIVRLIPLTGGIFSTIFFLLFIYYGYRQLGRLEKSRALVVAISPYFILGLLLSAFIFSLIAMLLIKFAPFIS